MKLLSTIAVLALVSLAPSAWAKTCAVTITGTDQMKFDQSAITIAPDCTEVAVTLKHSGKLAATVMGHNWVLTKSDDFRPWPTPACAPPSPTATCPRPTRA